MEDSWLIFDNLQFGFFFDDQATTAFSVLQYQ